MDALLFLAPLCGALALAVALGYRHDRTHRPGREFLFTLTSADVEHARYMRIFYLNVHGAER
jgi:hypothetical protein